MHKNLILKTIKVRNTKRYRHVQKELNVFCKNGLISLKYAEVVKRQKTYGIIMKQENLLYSILTTRAVSHE